MTASFEDLLRSTMIQTAEEAVSVNLIPRTLSAADRRRNLKVALAGVAAAAAIGFGAPLTFAATGQPSPSPSPVAPQPSPSPSPVAPQPSPSPSPTGVQPVPSPSLPHQFPCSGGVVTDPASPCYRVPIPSPSPYP